MRNIIIFHHHLYRTPIRILILTLFLFAVVACGSNTPDSKPVYKEVSKATLKAGDKIPVPQGGTTLTVTGKVGAVNSGSSIKMDVPAIESVGQIDYLVTDPFEKKDATFRGVLMSNLLDLWQVSKDATKLHILALDDYAVDVAIADLRKYPVVFALQQNGAYMPISTRGPAMLVFPYNDFKFDHTVYDNYWAWQIKSIEVQ